MRPTWPALVVVLVVACGGKVVVDQGAASGGSGGAGAAGPTAGSGADTASVGSATSCGCPAYCSALQSCGLSCPETCEGAVPAEQLQCVCNAGLDCMSVGACVGSVPPPDPGAPSDECIQCFQVADAGPCLPEYDACVADESCASLFQCEIGCNFAFDCVAACSKSFPAGMGILAALVDCSVCGQCWPVCSASSFDASCASGVEK